MRVKGSHNFEKVPQVNGTDLLPKDGSVAMTGNLNMGENNISSVGTVDGRNVNADGTKLDGIESAADVTDAANVNEAGALMHTDVSEAEGILRKTGFETYVAVKTNLGAEVDPGATDDSSAGYSVGSRWVNTATDKEFVCLDATAAAAVWKETTFTGGADPTVTLVEDTEPTTTTSSSDVLVPSMTITPAAGTYKVEFVGSVFHSANSGIIHCSIYAGGTKHLASERKFMRGSAQGNVTTSFTCLAKVTVNGAQAIEGKWNTDTPTASMEARQMMIMKVAAA